MNHTWHRIYSSTYSLEVNGIVIGYAKRTPVSNIKTDKWIVSKDKELWHDTPFDSQEAAREYLQSL